MRKKPIFKKILQVGLVVRDLDAAVKKQWEDYGIGPWEIRSLGPSTARNMIIRDQPAEFAMRTATTMIGEVMWELIQPLDEKSIYAEFLNAHGEGMHHLLFQVDDFDESVAYFREKGIGILQGAELHGIRFAYFDTTDGLCAIAEIFTEPKAGLPLPPPEATYP